MSGIAGGLADALDSIDVMELGDSFFEDLLDMEFVSKSHTAYEVAEQLLVVNLIQNIGPSIDDIVQFREGSTAGIAKLTEELDALDVPPADLSVVE